MLFVWLCERQIRNEQSKSAREQDTRAERGLLAISCAVLQQSLAVTFTCFDFYRDPALAVQMKATLDRLETSLGLRR